MRKRNQKDQSSNHSRAGKKQLVGKNLWTLALNLPPNGLPPSLGCPSSGSWTSSGRSSQWRSRSWWLGPQTAEWVSPLYFWLPGVIHFLMFLKKDMFKSTATSSGLAKVAASHFRTFLDGHKKCRHQLKIVQIDQRVGYVFWHSFIFELSKVIIDTAPGQKCLNILIIVTQSFMFYT